MLPALGSEMNWWKKLSTDWPRTAAGAVICASLGFILLHASHGLVLLSYDLLYLPWDIKGKPRLDDVVIIYMDDEAFRKLNQDDVLTWDLELHATLVDRMTADGARVVSFDSVFTYGAQTNKLETFAKAIRSNGKVVLAASHRRGEEPQIVYKGPVKPFPQLLEAAADLGLAEVANPPGATTRQYIPSAYVSRTLTLASWPWAAARVAGAEIATQEDSMEPKFWINYYGPALTLPHLSYAAYHEKAAGYYSNKCVFVGAFPKTLRAHQEADVLRTPHTRWDKGFFPGVEVGATAFLNFLRNDGFTEWAWYKQDLLIILVGLVCGAALSPLKPRWSIITACVALVVCLLVVVKAANHQVWFAWTVIAFVQLPTAVAWSIGTQFLRIKFQKEVLQETLEQTTRLVEATKAAASQKPGLVIPDHTLLRRIGKGAYGEVWLARNAIGAFHAVKIMRRRAFPGDEPYEREFHGIQKFMPISRTHPGFVHLLHVGRNNDEGYFFCIMEAGDDQSSGHRIDPDCYAPRTLSSELEWRGKLTPEECLNLGIALSDALQHLHENRLIHRDIKPANIIYAQGHPKFADIGLVTEIEGGGHEVSQLGTEGYMAPEGPGAPSADVYSLGKVLYEACMGRDRHLFPEVPTAVLEEPSDALIRKLNEIIFRACDADPDKRYQTAQAMHEELLNLKDLGLA